MKSFLNFLFEEANLDEAGIKFDDKYEFPKSDNVLFMTGGAGSGKGFILNNLLLFNGKVINKDDVQTMLMQFMKKHPDHEITQKFRQEYGKFVPKDQLSPRKSSTKQGARMTDTEKLHHFAGPYYKKMLATFIKNASTEGEKPNIVFDITGSELKDISSRSEMVVSAGYDPKNIHVAWVVTDVGEAISNNAARDRYVPVEILRSTHSGVKNTMYELLLMDYEKLKNIFDGHFFIIFNKKGMDVKVSTHKDRNANKDLKGKTIWTPPSDPNWINTPGGTPRQQAYIACHAKEPGKPVDLSAVDEFDEKMKAYLQPVGLQDGDKLDIALSILNNRQIRKYEAYIRDLKKKKTSADNYTKLKFVYSLMDTMQMNKLKDMIPDYIEKVVNKYTESEDDDALSVHD